MLNFKIGQQVKMTFNAEYYGLEQIVFTTITAIYVNSHEIDYYVADHPDLYVSLSDEEEIRGMRFSEIRSKSGKFNLSGGFPVEVERA
jgi:hypothetical protein